MSGGITWDVAKRNPAAAVAARRAGTTPAENRQIEQWTYYTDLDKRMRRMSEETARTEFTKLDSEVQSTMRGLFGEDGYLAPETTFAQRTMRRIKNVATSPFRGLLDVAEDYNRVINVAGLQVAQATVGSEKPDMGKILNKKTFDASWSGKALFNNEALKKIEANYDEATAFVAKQMLMGRMPGEIIEARGDLDESFMQALNSALNDPQKFGTILDDFERAKLSPGRDVARRLFGVRAGSQKSDGLFTAISGVIDAAYQVAIDPLTYVTLGTGTVATKGARLATLVQRGGSAGVAQAFADAGVKRLWDEVGPEIASLRQAREAYKRGDKSAAAAAGAARRRITEKYGQIDNDEVLNLLAESGVENAATAQKFFEQAENLQYLASGRVDNATFYRDGVATAYKTQAARNWFNTQIKSIARGKTAQTDVETFNNVVEGLAEFGRTVDTVAPMPENVRAALESQRTLVNRARNIFSRHPGSQAIVWTDEGVESTLPQVRSLTRMLGFDKNFSYAFGEHFRMSSQDQRIELVRGLYTGVMQKMGADDAFITKVMSEKFANTRGMGVEGEVGIPDVAKQVASSMNGGVVVDKIQIKGALHPSQATGTVGALPFDDLMAHAASARHRKLEKGNLITFMGGGIRNVFQSRQATNITNYWSFFNLFPRLGVRSAIDEGSFGILTLANDNLRSFVHGRMLRDVQVAYTGQTTAVGPIRNTAQRLTRRGAYSIPQATRRELADLANDIGYTGADEAMLRRKNRALETLNNKFGISPADYQNIKATDLIAEHAMNLYGSRLPDEIRQVKLQHMRNNSHYFESSVQSMTSRTANGSIARATIEGNPLTESEFTKYINDAGIEFGSKFATITADSIKALGLQHWTAAWFRETLQRFNGNIVPTGKGQGVDLAEEFFNHNGLKTAEDFQNAVDSTMLKSGFTKEGNLWVVKDEKKAKAATQWTGDTASRTNNAEVNLASVYHQQTIARFSDMRHTFHGTANGFNEGFVNYINSVKDTKGVGRALMELPFEQYEALTKGFLNAPTVNTNLIVPGINVEDMGSWVEKTQNQAMEMMDRQVTGMFRSPAFEAASAMSGLKWRKAQADYAKQLYNNGAPKEAAEALAERFYTEVAQREAAGSILKYVDNPEIRSQLSHSVKNVGRYYRATEDFIRRIYRLKDVKWQALYRMRLMHLGLDASGMMYTDSEGERYLMFPGDNFLYNTLDATMNALYGGNQFMRSGQYNEFTMKFSLANPSLQEDAARPTVSGPLGAITVLGIRNMLGFVGNEKVDGWADQLDELFLGPMGKDATMVEATMPSMLRNAWRLLPTNERERQMASATVSAAAYLFDVDKPLSPDATPEEKEEYTRALRVAAGNVLFMRSLLGVFFPVTPTVQESAQIPDYLKAIGVTSLSSEYQSVLDGVLKQQARDGDYDSDPFEVALKIFTEKNPGKAIYTMPRSQRTTKVRFDQNEKVKDWIIGNKGLVEKYGEDAALMFAPPMGGYDRSSSKWFRQQGLTESIPLDKFLAKAQVAELRDEYFRLGEERDRQVESVTSVTEARQISDAYEQRRRRLKMASPMLAASLEVPSPNDEMVIYEKLRALAADDKFPLTKIKRARLQEMLSTFENAHSFMTADFSGMDIDYSGEKARIRKDTVAKLQQLAGNDPQLQMALRMVFMPVMRFYSRDTVAINRRSA